MPPTALQRSSPLALSYFPYSSSTRTVLQRHYATESQKILLRYWYAGQLLVRTLMYPDTVSTGIPYLPRPATVPIYSRRSDLRAISLTRDFVGVVAATDAGSVAHRVSPRTQELVPVPPLPHPKYSRTISPVKNASNHRHHVLSFRRLPNDSPWYTRVETEIKTITAVKKVVSKISRSVRNVK